MVQDNTVQDCPYAPGQYGGSIATQVVSSAILQETANFSTFNNITVSGNTILNSPVSLLNTAREHTLRIVISWRRADLALDVNHATALGLVKQVP